MYVEAHCGQDELERLIAKAKCAKQRQRLRIVLRAQKGLTAEKIGEEVKLCERQVQEWGERFNAHGVGGLQDRKGRGRPCALTVEQQAQLQARLQAGPTAEDQVCTLRGEDVRSILQKEFGVIRKLSAVYYLSLIHISEPTRPY